MISSYQKHLSPKKGFCCAYGYVHGSGTCSHIVKAYISQYGVSTRSLNLCFHQFKLCSQAYKSVTEDESDKNKKEKDREKDKEDNVLINCVYCVGPCFPFGGCS